MHKRLRLFGCLAILSAILSALGALGCSGNKDQPDPTSHEALRKADPLEHGCAYVKQTQSSYGTASDSTNSNECTPGSCDELRAPAGDTAYAGGETSPAKPSSR